MPETSTPYVNGPLIKGEWPPSFLPPLYVSYDGLGQLLGSEVLAVKRDKVAVRVDEVHDDRVVDQIVL